MVNWTKNKYKAVFWIPEWLKVSLEFKDKLTAEQTAKKHNAKLYSRYRKMWLLEKEY